MILNEISICMQNVSKQDIQMQISKFLDVCHKLFQEKNDREFYYSDDLMLKKFGGIYTIHDWLRDDSVSKKEKDLFRSFINRGKRLRKEMFTDSELIIGSDCGQVSALGCLAAYEWEKFVISFASEKMWNDDWIAGTYISMEDADREVHVRNCSSLAHIDAISREEKQQKRLLISSGKELWEKREELYPHLVFCSSVKKQLESARVSMQIQTVMNRIQILEDYFATFNGRFDKERLGHGCRYESEVVQKDTELKKLRRFQTPYGEEEYFYWHISFPGNYPGRIHFLPDTQRKVGIVGYVGKHLPTAVIHTV